MFFAGLSPPSGRELLYIVVSCEWRHLVRRPLVDSVNEGGKYPLGKHLCMIVGGACVNRRL